MTAGDIGEYANYFVHLAVVNLRHRRQQQNGNKQHCIHCAKSMRMRFKLNYCTVHNKLTLIAVQCLLVI